ncbi:MAG: Dipeptide-binding protein DppE precursor [Candidatus Thorarchaeota archaeon AB_25]|nr:MAG: Dipeptide-binding protein DppE precursor [Candidatus Thorarchaeota archaeon AB_25]
MGRVCKRRLFGITLVMVFVFMVISPALAMEPPDIQNDLNVGPYVDRVRYKINEDYNARILNLLVGETEILSSYIRPDDLPLFEADADISLSNTVRNGYGHITINCNKYPFNISAFRRAFAYAFDKTRVTSELLPFEILSQEHDSVVPYSNSWCIEDDLPYHYYTAQVATGAAILDAAGFTIDPHSGYRLAPDGSPFDVIIQLSNITSIATVVGISVSLAAVDALTALDIDASFQVVGMRFDNFMKSIDNNEDFDMAFYAYNFPDNDVDWLGYHFWGELADIPFENPCNFRNATYDSWRNQLLHSTEYEEVYEAAAAMQMILHENVPLVVVYENISTQAFRNDMFTGHIVDPLLGIGSPWTLRKVQRADGSSGGTVQITISGSPNTFNIYLAANDIASRIMAELWPSLYQKGPDLSPIPYLAKDMKIETHTDNSSVQRDHTRFTIDIVQNAIWTDGTPLTAEDVVYSLKYAFESGVYGNPAGESLTKLVTAYAPTTYRAVIEFESESYWHFSNFAYDYIIPKHIYKNIGYRGWNSWDPVFWNTSVPYVTAGPFKLIEYVADEFVELSANPDFWYYPEERVTALSHLLFSNPVIQFSEVGVITVFIVGGTVLNRSKSS